MDLLASPTPPTEQPKFQVSQTRRLLLLAMPFLLVGLAYGIPHFVSQQMNKNELAQKKLREETAEKPTLDGAKLFAEHCAYCHGINGDGKGVAQLAIPARHYGYEKFYFVTTQVSADQGVPKINNPMPSDDDLMRFLLRGIPGSSMPSFAQLSEDERRAIIGHVRVLTRNGFYNRFVDEKLFPTVSEDLELGAKTPKTWTKMLEAFATKKIDRDKLISTDVKPKDRQKIAQDIELVTRLGPTVGAPKSGFPEPTPAAIENGRKLFAENCAKCHGPNGLGDGEQVKDPNFLNDNGLRATPRDLTKGIYKSGDDSFHIYARIMLGIPGTPMPATTTLTEKQVVDLVQFVQSLKKEAKP